VLERLLHAAVSQDRIGSVIELEALRALALAASDDEPAAVAALAEVVTLGGQWSIWIKEAYLDQEQPEVAYLGQQPCRPA